LVVVQFEMHHYPGILHSAGLSDYPHQSAEGGKSIPTQQVDVLENQGRQPRDIFRSHEEPFSSKLLESRIDIKGIPE
jgi:hypothetical protein